jgi:uncharacterized protein (DUF983 family)
LVATQRPNNKLDAMKNIDKQKTPSYFNIFKSKCPRCRRGEIFQEKNPYKLKSFMEMHDHCTLCGQEVEIEVGFYYGAQYVSYALAVALSVSTFVAWYVLIGFNLYDNRLFYWLGINAGILIMSQPYIQRLSRALWLSFFVQYEKDWKAVPPKKGERINENMSKAW